MSHSCKALAPQILQYEKDVQSWKFIVTSSRVALAVEKYFKKFVTLGLMPMCS